MKPKMQFGTLDGAIRYMNEHNINKEVYSPYVCRDCGQWTTYEEACEAAIKYCLENLI